MAAIDRFGSQGAATLGEAALGQHLKKQRKRRKRTAVWSPNVKAVRRDKGHYSLQFSEWCN